MPSDPLDAGLLSPATVGHDSLVSDRAYLDALVRAECALVTAYADLGVAPRAATVAVDHAFGLDEKYGRPSLRLDLDALAAAAVAGGNPVIPLVGRLKAEVPAEHAGWIHRGATSQDILDTAIMIVARAAVAQLRASLTHAAQWLRALAERHADTVAAARTLTQHAVPTTVGARAAAWERGIRRSLDRLDVLVFAAQLGGAAGTLASFVEITGSVDAAAALPEAYAEAAGLDVPDAPWHVTRWPVTELGDALAQAIDALGAFAADVATLSRTEIAEVSEGAGGGSSAMPQKQNPAEAVLIRSAALRAPQLAATLHLASALAVDERPDGAWHAEWPTLRELLRLALGASWHASSLAAHLRVDTDAVARNLALTDGRIVSERLRGILVPLIGADRFAALVGGDGDLGEALRALPETRDLDLDALLDPAGYVGLAPRLARGGSSGAGDGAETAPDRRDRTGSDANGYGVDE
ncbi:MAG: adenylosuccinate lyase [Microbacterium sp. 71-36]|uniref:lyase family protein n=1 Tax=unclassified Microbacterium TaxID=2609290 RepID=UPI00086FA1C5|nr:MULTISPECIES: lyase family protein [unclassified Microbacterium]MBN9211443.1 adenylosuccinate lyase [Microbacterium sp.]ODT36080.1 MAG: adenylosuccinate lyase [Microbacterium sp. SCN 71-17]OJV75164.1 MAG: adenylosuccinate lyase [Microbacterium sp. 71-36]